MYTPAQLANTPLSGPELGHIANVRRDLWPVILNHPNTPADLRAWILRQQSQSPAAPQHPGVAQMPAVPQMPASLVTPPVPQMPGTSALMPPVPQMPGMPGSPAVAHAQAQEQSWASWFRQTTGREPSAADYQIAVASGQLRPVGQAQHSTAAPFGFPGVSAATVAPGWLAKLPFVLAAAALLSILALLLPAVSVMGYSVNYFGAGTDAIFVLIVMLLVIALCVISIVRRVPAATITTGVVGIVAGVIAAIAGFGAIGQVSGVGFGAQAGPGAVLLGILSIVIFAASVGMFFVHKARS